MKKSFEKITQGYKKFREKYSEKHTSLMHDLAEKGQKPEIMLVSCCDSRVDPALLLQCHPGDLFIVRNIANIVPPYEADEFHHGTSAALEFGICYLQVKHLIIMGHSQCGGINAFLHHDDLHQDDFISRWTDLIDIKRKKNMAVDECAQSSLLSSYEHCLTFPWIKQRLEAGTLKIHLWFFDISNMSLGAYDFAKNEFKELS